jgi:hypothetical protein
MDRHPSNYRRDNALILEPRLSGTSLGGGAAQRVTFSANDVFGILDPESRRIPGWFLIFGYARNHSVYF